MTERAFHNCPQCGEKNILYDGIKKYNCQSCKWEFYQNTAAAVAGIIEYNGKVLVVERNREPGLGMYDFPGGFVDPMESAENALKREVMEELSVEIKELNYLCSAPNLYTYKRIEYTTCDMFFTAKIDKDIFKVDTSEIANYHWVKKNELNADKFAFLSMKEAIKVFLKA